MRCLGFAVPWVSPRAYASPIPSPHSRRSESLGVGRHIRGAYLKLKNIVYRLELILESSQGVSSLSYTSHVLSMAREKKGKDSSLSSEPLAQGNH